MAQLEVEGGQVVLGDVYGSLPAMEAILGQNLQIFTEAKSVEDMGKLGHDRTGNRRDSHGLDDMCVLELRSAGQAQAMGDLNHLRACTRAGAAAGLQ